MVIESEFPAKDIATEIEKLKIKFSNTNHKASSLDTIIMLDVISHCFEEIKSLKETKQ